MAWDRAVFGDKSRYAIMAIATLVLTAVVSNPMAFTFTVICMRPHESTTTVNMTTANARTDDLLINRGMTAGEEGWMFSAVAIGILVGSFPFAHLISYLGFRSVFIAFGTISVLSTGALPLAASLGLPYLFAIRVLQGVGMATTYPAMSAITSAWSKVSEYGLYLAIVSFHIQFSEIMTMPLAGLFCESSMGWPGLYYFLAVFTAICLGLFTVFYSDAPRDSWFVTTTELKKLARGREEHSRRRPLPYSAMLSDAAVWACFISAIGQAVAFIVFIQYGPTYLSKVLHFNVGATGFLMAVPYVVSIVAKLIAGPLCDRLKTISLKVRIVYFTFFAQLFNAVSFCVLAWMPDTNAILSQVLITLVIASNGLSFVGLARNAQVIAQHHSYFILSVTTLINSVCMLGLPSVVAALAPDNTASQWSVIFWISAGVVLVMNLFFVIMTKTEAREWTVDVASKQSQASDITDISTVSVEKY